MRRPTLPIALLLLASGCISDDPTPHDEAGTENASDSTTNSDAPPAPSELDGPPTLSVGDWWKYKLSTQLRQAEPYEYTLVIAGETPEAFLLGTPTDVGLNQSFFTHLPALGPVRKADLAPTRHGHPVPWVEWPLSEDKTWTVEVRGVWEAHPQRIQAKVAGQEFPAWRIDYVMEGRLQHRIEWAAATGWWIREEAYFGLDAPVHRLELSEWGHNRTGTALYAVATDVFVHAQDHNASAARANPTGTTQFTTRAADADWLLVGFFQWGATATSGGAHGVCGIDLAVPDGGPFLWFNFCHQATTLEWFALPIRDGTWTLEWHLLTDNQMLILEVFTVQSTLLSIGAPV